LLADHTLFQIKTDIAMGTIVAIFEGAVLDFDQ
jgi:hypothetical protein